MTGVTEIEKIEKIYQKSLEKIVNSFIHFIELKSTISFVFIG